MAGVVTPAVSGGASTPEKACTAAGRRSPLIGGGGVGLAQASDAPDPLAGATPVSAKAGPAEPATAAGD